MPASIGFRPCEARDIEAVLELWLRAEAVPRPTDHAAALRSASSAIQSCSCWPSTVVVSSAA